MTLTLLHGLVSVGDEVAIAAPRDLPVHQAIAVDGFMALVSMASHDLTDPDLPPEALAQAALAHNAILCGYAATHDVLPMRFGAAFSNLAAVRRHLHARAQTDAVMTILETLRGQQEFGIQMRVTHDPAATLPNEQPKDGRSFLRQRALLRDGRHYLQDQRARFVGQFAATLRAMTTDVRVGQSRPDRLCDLAVLVSRDDVAQLGRVSADHSLEAASLGLTLRQTGPWPAYSFVAPALESASDVA